MKVLVSGANGYIGKHLCNMLYSKGHLVYGLTRRLTSSQDKNIVWIESNLNFDDDIEWIKELGFDAFIHLAWQELDNYQSIKHGTHYIDRNFDYIKKIIKSGVKHIQVIGTCFEYGMVNGEISENHPKKPVTEYGKAKNTLRIKLENLKRSHEFTLQWVRLFYLYGEGQRNSSFVPLLQAAIDTNQKSFSMSGGEQIRDYLHVETAVFSLIKLLDYREDGIFNCCSNSPISMKDFALNIIRASNSSIQLKLGVFPYLSYEPMSFWGNNKKLSSLINTNLNDKV